MFAVQKHTQTSIREEELKNRVATVYFGKHDCTRIVGNTGCLSEGVRIWILENVKRKV